MQTINTPNTLPAILSTDVGGIDRYHPYTFQVEDKYRLSSRPGLNTQGSYVEYVWTGKIGNGGVIHTGQPLKKDFPIYIHLGQWI